MTEILDIGKVYANNKEENYYRIYDENHNYFKKYLGVFTNIYDAAERNGNITRPFGKNTNNNAKYVKIKSHNKGEKRIVHPNEL